MDDQRNQRRTNYKGCKSYSFVGKPKGPSRETIQLIASDVAVSTVTGRESKQMTANVPGKSATGETHVLSLGPLRSPPVCEDLLGHFLVSNGSNNKEVELCMQLDYLEFLDNVSGTGMEGTAQIELEHKNENLILRHFFEKLVPRIDAQEHSPWEKLILRYCSFQVARSCFISLASLHLYQEGGLESKDLYDLSTRYSDMIRSEIGRELSEKNFYGNIDSCKSVLVLISVYILLISIKGGISTDCRYYFAKFADICKQPSVGEQILNDSQMRVVVAVLSWYDTVATVMTPDCRLLACDPSWYGARTDEISTFRIMGCPGEIFQILAEICHLRCSHYHQAIDKDAYAKKLNNLIPDILRYREYVEVETNCDIVPMKCAQGWAVATYMTVLRILKGVENWKGDTSRKISLLVLEFLDLLQHLDPGNRYVCQMVYPLYIVGCECKGGTREKWIKYLEDTHAITHSGALKTLSSVMSKIWAGERCPWEGEFLLL